MYEKKNNSGSLWRERKERISTKTGKPYGYYSGDCIVDGKEYFINSFLNTVKTKDGDKEVYNLSFNLKQPKAQEPLRGDDGSVIPF